MSTVTDVEHTIPLPARVLGATGLIPFAVPMLILWFGPASWHPLAWKSLLAYGAVILSFVGAVHWGAALSEKHRQPLWLTMGWSVMPALIAWIALLLPGVSPVAFLLLGFAAQYKADVRAKAAARIPPWYLRLRLWLTLGVAFCLVSALLAVVNRGV